LKLGSKQDEREEKSKHERLRTRDVKVMELALFRVDNLLVHKVAQTIGDISRENTCYAKEYGGGILYLQHKD